MVRDVSDYLLDRSGAWGVRRIHGYPGDGIHGVSRDAIESFLPRRSGKSGNGGRR